jgi:hypothetical protein
MSRTPLAVAAALVLAACAGASTPPPEVTPSDAGTGSPVVSQGVGLHYDGAVAVKRAATTSSTGWEQVEFAAPLLPYYLGASVDIEGPNYPADQAARVDYVRKNTYTFGALLAKCAPLYPEIVVATSTGPAPTQAQLAKNYALVAQCSYEKFTVKPYWIPQLIDDVDVCGETLGAQWKLISEADLATLSAADYQYVQDQLSGIGTGFWGSFYYSLHTFLRAADGKLAAGDLTPGVPARVSAITYPMGSGPTRHYEGGLAPRCLWRHPVAQ